MIPTLLPYQSRWVRDRSGLKVCEKSRRIGLSWAEAYDSVLHAGAAGGANVYYQSYSMDMTRGFVDDCAAWARRLQIAADAVGETLIGVGGGGTHPAFRLPLASGREIVAMTSAPRGFRSKGRPGDRAIIDEAAFVDDLEEVLKAALAFRVWGGRVHVISTHNGEGSPFAALCQDVREGVVPGSLHRTPLRDALADGLHRRICEVSGAEWSPEAEARWEAELRAEYGARAAEELDCVPSAGHGAWLSWELIRAAEHPGAGAPEAGGGGPCWIGVDVARRRDLWVLAVVERVGDVLWTRQLETLRDAPFSAQLAALDAAVERWSPIRVAVDQTGMGEMWVETAQRTHGGTVEGVLLTAPRRLDVATALRQAAEDRRLRIPPDAALRADLHAMRETTGPTGAPRLAADRAGTDGHADRFWALALAVAASAEPGGPPEFAAGAPLASLDGIGGFRGAAHAGGWL